MPDGPCSSQKQTTSGRFADAIAEGLPYPLGATPDAQGVNFALFSAYATGVELCLFDEAGSIETERIALPELTD